MKNEVLQMIQNVIQALNQVQVVPGKNNYLAQGGAIAILEEALVKIQRGLTDTEQAEAAGGSSPAE